MFLLLFLQDQLQSFLPFVLFFLLDKFLLIVEEFHNTVQRSYFVAGFTRFQRDFVDLVKSEITQNLGINLDIVYRQSLSLIRRRVP